MSAVCICTNEVATTQLIELIITTQIKLFHDAIFKNGFVSSCVTVCAQLAIALLLVATP